MSEELLHDNPKPEIEELLDAQEHEYDGLRKAECSSGETSVHTCLCGFRSTERNDVTRHISEALGLDPLDEALAICAENYGRLRASRDSQAIKRVNRNTLELLQAMGL